MEKITSRMCMFGCKDSFAFLKDMAISALLSME